MPPQSHIFVAVNPVNWEYPALVETWHRFGKVTHFANLTGHDQWDSGWNEVGKPAYNRALLDAAKAAHRTQPLSLCFCYLSGRWLYRDTLRELRKLAPLVNISFDDTVAFYGHRDAGGWAGNAPIARHFNLNITCQNPRDVWKYRFKGAKVLWIPPGAPDDLSAAQNEEPNEVRSMEAVCFVGRNYGVRAKIVGELAHKFPLRALGKDWPGGSVERAQMGQIYRGSLINLGFGFIGESTRKIGLKGRDFEVTAAGGFYLTSYHPALAECFIEGQEIEFYRDSSELERKIRFYLAHPEKATEIGAAARQRVLREHLWSMRFETVLRHLSLDFH